MLGIDDWAWRKGHRYGTILCDLGTRKVLIFSPIATPTPWLHGCNSILVPRSSAATMAAFTRKPLQGPPLLPVQVADRWHLLRNLSKALEHALAPHHRLFTHTESVNRLDGPAATPVAVAAWSQRELLIQ